jgi:lysophospholipase L1-like esterase
MYTIRTVSLLTCVLLAGGQVLAGDDPTKAVVTLKKGDHILFFGDSLTALALKKEGYVTIVRETLTKKYPDLELKVSAVATGGHTVPDLLKRVDKDVIAQKPTIVFIQIGCNDARRIAKDLFKSGLEDLIDRLQKENIQVIQCSLTTVSERHDGKHKFDPQLEEFAQVARDVAKDKKVPLNDLRKVFMDYLKKNNPDNKESGFLTYDGNHFSDTGHRFVAERMLSKLQVKDKGSP